MAKRTFTPQALERIRQSYAIMRAKDRARPITPSKIDAARRQRLDSDLDELLADLWA